MKKVFCGTVALISIFLLYAGSLFSQQLAFPGAEGYGKYVTGGRGGAVYEVTNLNSSGAGSFGEAIGASGPRIVVFRVSGTITGNFNIKNNDITIAGQTAPGDGICIKGNLSTSADNIIIRYIRVRYDPAMGENDGIGGRYHRNIIIDHVSASWSTDETFTLYHNENTTVQWCIISEACPKGTTDEHRFGGIWGNNYGSWHHNLIAHNASRNPRWASGCGFNDYRNNVLYNWQYQSCYGGEKEQDGMPQFSSSTINIVANYYKPGPATNDNVKRRIAEPSARSGDDKGSWYVSGNYVDGYPDVTTDNWKGVDGSNYIKLSTPWNAMPINQESPEDAYNSVLTNAGCSFPTRDKVDADIIDDVINGTAKYGNNGIIDSPADVGGWPTLASETAPVDSDHDGMPDSWEDNNGLNKNDPNDRNGIGEGGYTNLEVYLYKLVGDGGPVTGVSISAATDSVGINSTIQLNAIIEPYNASNQNLIWTSSDTAVAKVNLIGQVTGITEGSATITVTTDDGGFTAQRTVVVINMPVTGVEISPNTLSINIGATGQLNASVIPSNAINQNLNWSSNNTSVATVDASGLVTGISEGTATISATSEEGGFKAQCIVTVIPAEIYQAENYTSQSGNSVLTDFAGYTGTAYVDFGSEGAYLEWNIIDGGTGGSASLIFRYANGSSNNRQCALSVNGNSIGNLSFPSTGMWGTWSTQTIVVNLNSGNNTVRLTVNTSDGGPNLDYVNVSSDVTAINQIPSNLQNNFTLFQNYPNPFNSYTTIRYDLGTQSNVNLSVYNAMGENVATLVNQRQSAGEHVINFDAKNLEGGVYFYRLKTGLSEQRGKMLILK